MEKRRIMVVEDEAIVALDIVSRLKHLGYHAAGVAASGEQAVLKAGEVRPDLILMDIMLEGQMDGIEAAAIIKEQYGIPVVYLTAYADSETLQRAKVTSPFGYIIKPFEDRELLTTIEMAVYKFETEAKLVMSERWLSTTLRNLGEAVVTTDAAGAVQFLNPVAEHLLGCTLEKAQGLNLRDIFREEQQCPPALMGQTTISSTVLHTPDGRCLPIEKNVSPIIDDRGVNMGNVLVFRDISDRLRSEEAVHEYVSNLRRTLEATVEALAVTSEKRDPYTAGHQQRVSALACAIARALGLEGERLEGLRVGGLLHDLGKIYIPAEILAKPALLTTIEFGLIKTHSEVGYEILKNIPFPWPVADMVLQHHERLNGSGYPHGLSNGQLMLEAKILSVADVVEAMSSHRPYRAALGLERALGEIKKNRGTLYDPEIVDACVHLFESEAFSFELEPRQ